jgi:hypothetical protein
LEGPRHCHDPAMALNTALNMALGLTLGLTLGLAF